MYIYTVDIRSAASEVPKLEEVISLEHGGQARETAEMVAYAGNVCEFMREMPRIWEKMWEFWRCFSFFWCALLFVQKWIHQNGSFDGAVEMVALWKNN